LEPPGEQRTGRARRAGVSHTWPRRFGRTRPSHEESG
jgi:hypothetical protein